MDIVGDLMKVAVSGDNLTALSKSMGIADKAKAPVNPESKPARSGRNHGDSSRKTWRC